MWQWTETPIAGFDGFQIHPYYDDWAAPWDGPRSSWRRNSISSLYEERELASHRALDGTRNLDTCHAELRLGWFASIIQLKSIVIYSTAWVDRISSAARRPETIAPWMDAVSK